jgi:hypothetical protein
MPWIAHRRRGSKFGHHSFWFALVSPPLLPLALSTLSLCDCLVQAASSHSTSTCAFDLSQRSIGTDGDTSVLHRLLLSCFLRAAAPAMLTAGPLLCL